MKINLYALAVLLILLVAPSLAEATHLRGGYIHYTLDEGNPRKVYFTMTLYTALESPADELFAMISMGDGITVRADRHSKTVIRPNVVRNIFNWEYTFPATGTFAVSWIGQNRNAGILNLAAPADQLSMGITTHLTINTLSPNWHGVQIKSELPFIAYQGEPLRFNLLAYDLDGDSLGYELIAPLHEGAQKVIQSSPGFTVPEGFSINRFGEVYWENPDKLGEYAYAVRVTQYRNGRAVGYTVLDMQFLVMHAPSLLEEARIENKEELSFTKDGQLLVKPGEKLTLKLRFPANTEKAWLSELQHREVDDLKFAAMPSSASGDLAEFSFTATEQLNRKQPYAVNFYYHSTWPGSSASQIFTVPILVWQPEEVELELLETENLPRTTEGYIASTPDNDIKVLLFAKNGLGNKTELSAESNLRDGADHFSFVTRDSADSVVGELRFKPSESQISATPYTITLRSTSMQLRTSKGSAGEAQEVNLKVLVSATAPLSSGNDLATGKPTLYPNPATDKFTIDAPELPELYLQLHDVHGKKVKGYTLITGQNNITRPASLAKGLYFYTLTSRSRLVSSGKLVLQ